MNAIVYMFAYGLNAQMHLLANVLNKGIFEKI